nr:hypothetical protein [uncultured Campylobacter sp.]
MTRILEFPSFLQPLPQSLKGSKILEFPSFLQPLLQSLEGSKILEFLGLFAFILFKNSSIAKFKGQ